MKRPLCLNCPYWQKDDEELHEVVLTANEEDADFPGECRRHAPSPWSINLFPKDENDDNENNEYISWPIVGGNEWCGEHPGFPEYIKSLKNGPSTNTN